MGWGGGIWRTDAVCGREKGKQGFLFTKEKGKVIEQNRKASVM